MASVDPMSLAESVLASLVDTHPALFRPRDIHIDQDARRAQGFKDLIHRRRPGFESSPIFSYLLGEELRFENDLLERGYAASVFLDNGPVLIADHDGHVRSGKGTVIKNVNGTPLLIKADAPVVASLIESNSQRSAADRIRVATYIVRLLCNPVTLLAHDDTAARDAVRTLSNLIGFTGLKQAANPSDHANDTKDHR